MAAAVVKVGDHVRALEATKIGKGDRENWATAIYHMLNHLATASSRDIGNIWRSIVSMLSDLCKVNLHLANEVKKAIVLSGCQGRSSAICITRLRFQRASRKFSQRINVL